jgi:RHS repeat-associated protein
MLQATKAETFSVPMAWRGDGALPLAADPFSPSHVTTTAQLSENSRLGFARKNVAPHQGNGFVNSTSALGIEPVLVTEGVRSSSSGRENDGTGLYFYRARYYNPSLQRFVSEDPIGLTAGPNLYAYGLNSPVDLNDPSGLWTGQLGISGSVTVFGVTFVGSVGIAVDGQGNIGTYSTSGAMLGPGANASLGVSAAYSNGQDITALRGPFGNISASGGEVASGTVDAFSGPGNGPGGVVTGVGVTGGFGFGGAASAGGTTTTVTPRFGPLAPSPGGSCDASGGCGGGGGGGIGPNPGGSSNGGSGSTAGRKR